MIFNLTLGLMAPVCFVLHMLTMVGGLDFGRVPRAPPPLLGVLALAPGGDLFPGDRHHAATAPGFPKPPPRGGGAAMNAGSA